MHGANVLILLGIKLLFSYAFVWDGPRRVLFNPREKDRTIDPAPYSGTLIPLEGVDSTTQSSQWVDP